MKATEDQSEIQCLINHFKSSGTVSDEMAAFIKTESFLQTFAKGKFLDSPLEEKPHLYYILDGAVRGFVKDGSNEITTWIYLGNNIVGLTSFEKSYSIQASQYIQALITTRVVVLPYKLIMSLFENYPEMLVVSRNLLWKHYQELDERNYMIRLPTAEKRLNRLMETHPEILMVVQHKHIANYLCMRFETLSRLRAKLVKKTY